nr:PAS domain S-box protein [Micromonospora sp. DSM 115978]
MALARSLDDPRSLASALAQTYWGRGAAPAEQVLAAMTEALRLAEQVGDEELGCSVRATRVPLLAEIGRLAELREEIAAFRSSADRLGQNLYHYHCEQATAALALADGNLDEAAAAAQHALELSRVEGYDARGAHGIQMFGVRRELAARRSRSRLHDLLGNAHDVIVLIRDGETVAFMSPSAERLLGQRGPDWTGAPFASLVHADDRDLVAELVGDPGATTARNVRLCTADGEVRWFDLEASDQRDDPDLAGVLVTCHEVGERKALEDQLAHQARHDGLTGLPNRAAFM